MSKILGRFAALLCTIVSLSLAACGGGGGGGGGTTGGNTIGTTPTVYTANCPDGTTQTSTIDQATANAACPAVTVTASPADGATNVPTSTTVTFTANGTLDSATVTAANVTFVAAGTTAVAKSVAVSADNKTITVTPAAALSNGQSYAATLAGVKDSVGNTVVGTTSFTVAAISCTGLAVSNAAGTACITPTVAAQGTQVVGANQLPAGCNSWKDQCWRDAVADGTVKFVATSATDNTGRSIVFAYFRNTSTAFGVTGLWNELPFYADDGSSAVGDITGGGSSEIDWMVTNNLGEISHEKSTGLCYQTAYDAAHHSWDINGTGVGTPIPCPF